MKCRIYLILSMGESDKKEPKNYAHFDTNHYPHIVYETNEELIEKLKAKISAWID